MIKQLEVYSWVHKYNIKTAKKLMTNNDIFNWDSINTH